MTDTPIPDDVMKVADAAFVEAYEECSCLPVARAILADREAQAKRVEELEEALKPFATEADAWEGFEDDEALTEGWPNGPSTNLHVSDLRQARALLAKEGSDA